MRRTIAIYHKTENGLLRLGTFTPRNAVSIRHISQQIRARHPGLKDAELYMAQRIRLFGRWVDDKRELLPLDQNP